MKTKPTKLNALIDEGAEVERKLAAMPPRKLSTQGFLKMALGNAEATEADLDALERKLESADTSDLQRFIRRVARVIGDGHCPVPDHKFSRMINVYGTEPLDGQIALAGTTVPLSCALAVRRAAGRYPSAFGTVDDLAGYDKQHDDLTSRRDRIYAEMLGAFTGDDLIFDSASVTKPERDSGLVRASFRRASGVSLVGAWPQRLVQAAVCEDAAKVKEAA